MQERFEYERGIFYKRINMGDIDTFIHTVKSMELDWYERGTK